MSRAQVAALGGALTLLGCAGASSERVPARPEPSPDTVAVGAGRYTTARLAGEKPPSNQQGRPVEPKVSPAFTAGKAVPTSNDWWSSLIWQFDRGGKPNPYSEPLFAHPLHLQALPEGLGLGSAGKPQVASRTFFFPYVQDLRVGIDGLVAPAARVSGYTDWTVTAEWSAGTPARALTATFGHGLPFAYFEATGGPALIELDEQAEVAVFAETPGSLGITVAGRPYGLFVPSGATWTREPGNRRFRSDLRGRAARGVFSVAVLPDAVPATLARFRRHAFAFVTGARVSWRYDAARAELRSTFDVATAPRDPATEGGDTPLLALYPHQWKNLGSEAGPASYPSPRGAMKLLATASFTTRLPFRRGAPGFAPAARGRLRGLRPGGPGARRRPGRAVSQRPRRHPGDLLDRQVAAAGRPAGLAGRAGGRDSGARAARLCAAGGPRGLVRRRRPEPLLLRPHLGHAHRPALRVPLGLGDERPPLPLRPDHLRRRHRGPLRSGLGAATPAGGAWSSC